MRLRHLFLTLVVCLAAPLLLAPAKANAIAYGFKVNPPGPNWSVYIANNHSLAGYFVDEKTCTGSLISRYWVLTAAHCVTDETSTTTSRHTPEDQLVMHNWEQIPARDLDLAIGRADLDDSHAGFDSEVSEVIVHPKYAVWGVRKTGPLAVCGLDCRRLEFADNDYDFALLKLKTPAPVGTNVIPLADKRTVTGDVITVYGYGRTESGSGASRELRSTDYGSYTSEDCRYRADEPHDSECLVGANDAKSRIRPGDSGGPMMAFIDGQLRQVALTSLAIGDNADSATGVSTVHALDWIRRTANLPSTAASADSVAMALTIDSSGSMTSNDPSNRRLSAAESYLAAAGAADVVGVVDFDDAARIASVARNARTERDALVSAIRTIDSSGGTDIGAGVARACDVLRASGAQASKAAILLTDGEGSYNNENSCFRENGWKLFTFGLGNSVDRALLSRIADETGGRYQPLPTTSDLVCEFQQVRSLAAGGSAKACVPTGTVSAGQRVHSVVNVASNLLQMVFSISWPGSDLDLELTSPSGRVITTGTDAFDVTAEESSTFETITVANPEAGVWSVEVIGVDVAPGGEPYSLSSAGVPMAGQPPTAAFTATPGESGTVSFDASGSSDEAGIDEYRWDFGDGFAARGSDVEHTYREGGEYIVTLKVLDASLQVGTAERTVTVADTRVETGVDGSVGASVPATLALTLGAPATFGVFVPGVAKSYTASMTASVTSSAGDATLTVADPGHLTNGAFSLAQPLGVGITPPSWDGPVANAPVAVVFEQRVGADEALRTGNYSRTLTFVLATSNP